GNFSLLAQRKVTKRNAPQALHFSGFLPEKYAAPACVPPIAHPCASGGIGAIHRAAPAGIAAAAAAMQWGPNSSALLRAEAKKKSEKQKVKEEQRYAGCFAWARRMRVALGPLHVAAAADDQARQGRRGTAPIPLGTWTYLQRNPAADADFSGRSPK